MQTSLKFATYNIHRCFGRDQQCDPDRILAVIRELDADIVALQEVETFVEGGRDVLEIFEELEYSAIAGPTMYRHDSVYGNAVLTRLPPEKKKIFDISYPGFEPRGVISLLYRVNDLRVHVMATHLGLRIRERRFQAKSLLRIADRQPADVTVLLGDVNEWRPWGRVNNLLHTHFGRNSFPPTFPARMPLFSLDQILVKPKSCIDETDRIKTPLSKEASDHLPLTVTVRLDGDSLSAQR